jgi:hypothetical protein
MRCSAIIFLGAILGGFTSCSTVDGYPIYGRSSSVSPADIRAAIAADQSSVSLNRHQHIGEIYVITADEIHIYFGARTLSFDPDCDIVIRRAGVWYFYGSWYASHKEV